MNISERGKQLVKACNWLRGAATPGTRPVALMRGHGNVVVGPDVQTAVARAIYTEVNAGLQTIAIELGGPVSYITAEEGAARDKMAFALPVVLLWSGNRAESGHGPVVRA